MTDPIAEAAAAQQAANEPSLLEKAQETIHQLEEKIEHMIHPDAAPSSTEPVQEVAASVAGETPAVSAAAEPSATSDTTTAAPVESATTQVAAEAPNAVATESAADVATPSAPATEAAEVTSGSAPTASESASAGDAPNAAASAESTSANASASSAPSASPVDAIVGLRASAGDRARAAVKAIKDHLSLQGFEQSSVATIHSALADIEDAVKGL